MQFTEQLEIWDAVIGDVKVKNSNGTFSLRIEVRGQLTPEIAGILGCRTAIYAKNGTPHEGFTSIEDATAGCQAFRTLLEVDGLKQTLEINGDKVDDIYIEKVGKDGALRLSLRMHYSADPLPFFDYWKLVGTAPGICKMTPLQQELQAEDKTEVEIRVPGEEPVKTNISTLRRAAREGVASSHRGKKKTRAVGH